VDSRSVLIAGGLALSLAVAGLGLGHLMGSHWEGRCCVTVDLVRITNAERKAFGVRGGDEIEMLRIGRSIAPTIAELAGGRIVLVKQSVVGGDLPDLTDQVLDRLGLPKDAPTIDLRPNLSDVPTTGEVSAQKFWDEWQQQHKPPKPQQKDDKLP